MWEIAKENRTNINNIFPNVSVHSMNFREENIILNNLCVWALFIDPNTKKEMVMGNCLDIQE